MERFSTLGLLRIGSRTIGANVSLSSLSPASSSSPPPPSSSFFWPKPRSGSFLPVFASRAFLSFHFFLQTRYYSRVNSRDYLRDSQQRSLSMNLRAREEHVLQIERRRS